MNDEFSTGGDAAGTHDVVAADGRHEEPVLSPRLPPAGAPLRPDDPQTAGGLIRVAREAQGIDLASLAAMLKIPLRKLEALEEGRHADLPGPTFERALAQASCRVLKIDPKPVLAQLPRLGGNTLEPMDGGINAPFRERQGRSEGSDAFLFLRPVLLLPILLAAAALALFYLPSDVLSRLPGFGAGGAGASAPGASASGVSISSVALAPQGSDSGAVQATVPATSPVTSPAASATAPSASSIPPSTAPATEGAAAVDEVLAHPATEPGIPVQVTAGESSWIEVVDAQGHTLLSRTVLAGESVGLDGMLPMKVKVGNSRATRLTLRGENVDLEPYTRDNVARLELK